ncbi:hypothetical protein [Peribacillus frigoritolerans]|uniref:hypothetical protein n=1 Tax=Peribacillus frigoritolerans TaxID=450367 RepID=UPI003019B1D1
MMKTIKRMTSVGVIRKQEEYRERTISEVGEMTKAGCSKDEVAQECGLSNAEVDAINRGLNRTNLQGRPNMRRFY